MPEFWIYQDSKYASGFGYARILQIPEFWMCQGYAGFRKCPNNFWICLIMPRYIWICLKIIIDYLLKWAIVTPKPKLCTGTVLVSKWFENAINKLNLNPLLWCIFFKQRTKVKFENWVWNINIFWQSPSKKSGKNYNFFYGCNWHNQNFSRLGPAKKVDKIDFK